jgi:hypothetical protein
MEMHEVVLKIHEVVKVVNSELVRCLFRFSA